jgi:hypothetical protein
MIARSIVMIACLLFASIAGADGSGALTQKGIKSTGSSMAFLDMCEVAGLAPEGITERYRKAAQEGLTRAHWDSVDRQYNESLKEKMMYMSSRDSWMAFDVEPVACEQVAKVTETLIKNFEELAELQKD